MASPDSGASKISGVVEDSSTWSGIIWDRDARRDFWSIFSVVSRPRQGGRFPRPADGPPCTRPAYLLYLHTHNTHSQNAGMITAIISPRAHPPTCQMKDRWRTFYRTKKKKNLPEPSLISKRRQKMAEAKCWICPCGWHAPDIVNHLQFTVHRTTRLLNFFANGKQRAKTSGTGRQRMRQPGAIGPAWPELEINPIYLRPEKSAELPNVQNAFRSQCMVKEVWT